MKTGMTLTWVMDNGEARTLKADGFGAETVMDVKFAELNRASNVQFAILVLDDGGYRNKFYKGGI